MRDDLWATPITAMVPCYDEELCIERAYREISAVMAGFAEYEILFVDDGSKDGTLDLIKSFAATDSRVRYLAFARNFGLEAAFSAGFKYASYRWTVQLDADLQSPPTEIPKLVEKALEGYDIVFGVRVDRQDPVLRRWGSSGLAFVARRLLAISLPMHASVFRVSRTSVARRIVLAGLRTPYFIATAPLIGARCAVVPTEHSARVGGTAKWSLTKLVSHAMDLFVGFSVRPLAAVQLTSAFCVLFTGVVLALLALGRIGSAGTTAAVLVVNAAAFLGLGVLTRYLIPSIRVRGELPSYLIREGNLPIDAVDDLYAHDEAPVTQHSERTAL
ncbi:glycosyltransferase family 2 protein [Actinoplanes friuliensis]|uniref:Glycosyl transferase n=1 Tax=Actinoplanes friuliensis DSM 7358 TaxID=1246995 RepID=U5WDQ8_9ACTN|nr:glycosyltransferase family 2 protein [Actinoplanes friuliensis]AGZ46046.1 glycosyl transferase [Actinoplanes friuliensis DSM 7358]